MEEIHRRMQAHPDLEKDVGLWVIEMPEVGGWVGGWVDGVGGWVGG